MVLKIKEVKAGFKKAVDYTSYSVEFTAEASEDMDYGMIASKLMQDAEVLVNSKIKGSVEKKEDKGEWTTCPGCKKNLKKGYVIKDKFFCKDCNVTVHDDSPEKAG